jgi:hypothetical protein
MVLLVNVPSDRLTSLSTPLLQPAVERLQTVRRKDRHQVVAAGTADQGLDVASPGGPAIRDRADVYGDVRRADVVLLADPVFLLFGSLRVS